MDINKAKEIISILAEGIEQTTGELLDANNVCNKGEVVRAFFTVIKVLDDRVKKRLPENAGKPWIKDEERYLEELYNKGLSKKEISKELSFTLIRKYSQQLIANADKQVCQKASGKSTVSYKIQNAPCDMSFCR